MSRIAYCEACAAIEHGIKSRIAFEHTCGLHPSEWPVAQPRKTFQERLAEEQEQQELEKQARQTSEYQLAPEPKPNNTQLPAEVVHQIEEKALLCADFLSSDETVKSDYLKGYKTGRVEGATEYATKLQLCEGVYNQVKEELSRTINKLIQAEQENQNLKDQIEKYVLDGRDRDFKGRALLEKVVYRHEGGLLPDRFIYNEIKTFLDRRK